MLCVQIARIALHLSTDELIWLQSYFISNAYISDMHHTWFNRTCKGIGNIIQNGKYNQQSILKSPSMNIWSWNVDIMWSLLKFDCARRYGCDIVETSVDIADLVDYPSSDFLQPMKIEFINLVWRGCCGWRNLDGWSSDVNRPSGVDGLRNEYKGEYVSWLIKNLVMLGRHQVKLV